MTQNRSANGIDSPARKETQFGYLNENLPFLTRLLRTYLRQESKEFLGALEPLEGEIVVLSLIAMNEGISQKDVAAAVVIKKSAATRLLNQLEQRGMIRRRVHARDRRANMLYLTEAGRRRLDALERAVAAQDKAMFEALTVAERRELIELLGKLIGHLSARQARRRGAAGVAKRGAKEPAA